MNARTQHTPGPWQVNDNTLGEFSILNSRGDMRVATVAFGQVADTANARLIASAPDLLAVLEQVRDFWAGGDAPEALENAIHAAIARAKGENK